MQGHHAVTDIKCMWPLSVYDTQSWLQSVDILAKCSMSYKGTDVATSGHGQAGTTSVPNLGTDTDSPEAGIHLHVLGLQL